MTAMFRAYSLLQIRSVSEERRVISGIATTPTPDRMGDIVEPLGVSFTNPLSLLWQHERKKPVGLAKFGKPTKDGIPFEAELPVVHEAGILRDRLEEAWQSIKLGLVRAVSIGFRALEYAFLEETDGIRFTKSEVYELSLVTIPAQPEAMITGVGKSIDAGTLAILKKFDTNALAATGIIARSRNVETAEPPVTLVPAAIGTKARVVRLDAPARDRANPFIIRSIKR